MAPKKILIVDDSTSIRQQVSGVLAGVGFEMIEAADGVEGAEFIHSCLGLSLVICDVNMPRLGGLEMLDSVKDELARRSLPVVMLNRGGRLCDFPRQAAGERAGSSNPQDQLLTRVQETQCVHAPDQHQRPTFTENERDTSSPTPGQCDFGSWHDGVLVVDVTAGKRSIERFSS